MRNRGIERSIFHAGIRDPDDIGKQEILTNRISTRSASVEGEGNDKYLGSN